MEIRHAAKGSSIQVGNILFVRSDFVEAYHAKSTDERAALARRALSSALIIRSAGRGLA
jgi:hypothetical protein